MHIYSRDKFPDFFAAREVYVTCTKHDTSRSFGGNVQTSKCYVLVKEGKHNMWYYAYQTQLHCKVK